MNLTPPILPGPLDGFVAVIAFGLPLPVSLIVGFAQRAWSAPALVLAVFASTIMALLASWWLVWPVLFWLSAR